MTSLFIIKQENKSMRLFFSILTVCLWAGPLFAAQTGTPSGAPAIESVKVLSLDTAKQIALENNPSIEAAIARIAQAKQIMAQARSAYFPQIDASAGASRQWLSDVNYNTNLASARLFNPLATIEDPEDYYSAGISAGWLLFDGFSRKFANLAASLGKKRTEAGLAETRRLLLSAVATSFFSAQLSEKNLAISHANKNFQLRQLEDAQARKDLGAGSLSDVLNFRVLANEAQSQVISAQGNYQAALAGLASLLGIADAKFPSTMLLAKIEDETEEELTLPNSEPLLSYARSHRPDIQEKELSVKQAQSEKKSAKSGYYPSLSLGGSYEGQRARNADFLQEDFGGSVGLSLSYNLFSGGYTRARVKEASQKILEAEKSLENAKLSVGSDVQVALANLQTAQKQVVLQRTNKTLVRQNRDLVEKEYKAGQGSLVRLNDAQRNLTNTENKLAAALASLRKAWHDLDTATAKVLFMGKTSE